MTSGGHSTTTLQNVCHLITDGKHGDCEPEENSGYYFLSAKDVRDGKLVYKNSRQITKEDFLQTHRRTQLEPLDILIVSTGATIGRMAMASDNEFISRTTFQKSVAILKPNKELVSPHWLYYKLNQVKDLLINMSGGTAQGNLLLRDLRAFEIEIPSLSTQRRIADILSAYDDLIEKNTRRIRILEQMAQAIYQEWFGKVDKESLPKGWRLVKLSEIADVNSTSIKIGSAPEEINYVDIASVSTGKIDAIQPMKFSVAPGRARRIVQHGDVIWSTVRPNRKSYSLIINPPENMIVSTGFAVLRVKNIPFSYLYLATTTEDFAGYLTNHATGSAYPAVNSSDFENAEIVLPPKDLLNKFDGTVSPMFILRETLLIKNANLRQTRDLLLPRLVSGEVEV